MMNHSSEKAWGNVRHLVTERDLAGSSRARQRVPLHKDPIYQLVAAFAALVVSLIWSLTTSGVPKVASQSLVIASSVVGLAVLLRSVRHGWNLAVYGKARRAMWREVTLRTERDALREVSLRCASLRRHGSSTDALEAVQSLVSQTKSALERAHSSRISVAVVEEVGGYFVILCLAGYMRGKPHHLAPGKKCRADQPFPSLLEALAFGGPIAVRKVESARRFWVGIAAENPDLELDKGALETVAAWVSLLDDMDLMPARVQHLKTAV